MAQLTPKSTVHLSLRCCPYILASCLHIRGDDAAKRHMRIHMSEHTMTDDRITHGCNKYIDLPIRSVTHRTSYPSGLTRPLCLGGRRRERKLCDRAARAIVWHQSLQTLLCCHSVALSGFSEVKIHVGLFSDTLGQRTEPCKHVPRLCMGRPAS